MKKLITPIFIVALVSASFISCHRDANDPTPQVAGDTTKPVITINGGNFYEQYTPQIPGTGVWVNPTASAYDNVDGDVSSTLVITGTVDPNTPGWYDVWYTAHDGSNNTGTVGAGVHIVDCNFHQARYLEGTYNVVDSTVSGGVAYYTCDWKASTINDHIVYIKNLDQSGTQMQLTVSVDTASHTLQLANQPISNSVNLTNSYVCTYTHNGNSVNAVLHYTVMVGSISEDHIAHLSK